MTCEIAAPTETAAPAATGSPSKYESHQALLAISRQSGTGSNVTKDEFQRLDSGGQLNEWKAEFGYEFSELDLNGSGRISEINDGGKLRAENEAVGGDTSASLQSVDSGALGDSAALNGESSAIASGGASDSGVSIGDGSGAVSGDVVVLQFGWSDTSTSSVDSALNKAGITNFERSDSADKGLGIAVVTRDQANAFKSYADGTSKVFANIQNASGGIDSTGDLSVGFSTSSSNKAIGFGGGDYGGIVTDDPSKIASGSAIGQQKGDDALWSTQGGNRAQAQMWDGAGGRQYVTMDARIQ